MELKAQSRIILTTFSPSRRSLINSQCRSPRVSRQRNQMQLKPKPRRHLKATKQQRPSAYSCPHTCHHMLTGRIIFAGLILSVFANSKTEAMPGFVSLAILHFYLHCPCAHKEAQVSCKKKKKSEVKLKRRSVSIQ